MNLDRTLRRLRRSAPAGILAAAAVLPGCNHERVVDILTSPIPTQIAVEPKGLALQVGRTATLRVSVTPGNDTRANWASSNAAVATVDAGFVTCVAPGAVVITVTSVANPTLSDLAGIACLPGTPNPQPSTQPSPPPTAPDFISPRSLSFEHIVGSSPCPQTVGEFTVTNNAVLGPRIFVSTRPGSGALEVSPAEFQLEPGESRRVRVVFNCSRQDSFTTVIHVSANSGSGPVGDGTVQVSGTIR